MRRGVGRGVSSKIVRKGRVQMDDRGGYANWEWWDNVVMTYRCDDETGYSDSGNRSNIFGLGFLAISNATLFYAVSL